MWGFLFLILVGWIPVAGAVIAGFIAGVTAAGGLRGAQAGFIAGFIGAIIAVAVTFTFGGAVSEFMGPGPIALTVAKRIGGVVLLTSIRNAVLTAIGGALGGAIRHR